MKITVACGLHAKEAIVVDGERARIGAEPFNELVLTDRGVSREHAEFRRNGVGWHLVDLGSTNGTFINGRRVTRRTPVFDGDIVRVAQVELTASELPRGKTVALEAIAVPDAPSGGAPEVPPASVLADNAAQAHPRTAGSGVAATRVAAAVPGGGGKTTARFVLEVIEGPDPGRMISIPGRGATLGRHPDSDIVVSDPCIGRMQCRFVPEDGKLVVINEGQTNPLLVDGREPRAAALRHGMILRIAGSRFLCHDAAVIERSAPRPHPRKPQVCDPPVNRKPGLLANVGFWGSVAASFIFGVGIVAWHLHGAGWSLPLPW